LSKVPQVFQTLITNLTAQQREKLHAFSVDATVLSRWKSGKRLPTEPQAVALADVCGVDRHKLQDEIALLKATPEQRRLLERLMGKARGVVAMLICGVSVAVAGAALGLNGHGAGRLFSRR
jgi:hypothetical protein